MRTHLLEADHAWREAHLGATVGVLAIHGAANPPVHAGQNDLAATLEADVRARFESVQVEGLRAEPPLPAYAAYYRAGGSAMSRQASMPRSSPLIWTRSSVMCGWFRRRRWSAAGRS